MIYGTYITETTLCIPLKPSQSLCAHQPEQLQPIVYVLLLSRKFVHACYHVKTYIQVQVQVLSLSDSLIAPSAPCLLSAMDVIEPIAR